MGFNPFKKIGKWAKKQYGGGLSVRGLKSSVKGSLKPKNLGYTLGALTLGAAALPGVSLGGMASGAGNLVKSGAGKIGGLFGGGGGGVGDLVEGAGDIAGSQPGRFRSIVSGAGKFLGGNDGFGMDDVLKYGKAAGDAFGAYDTHQTVDRHRKLMDQEYAAGAPLRDAARRMLMEDTQPMQPMAAVEQPRYRRVNVGGRL